MGRSLRKLLEYRGYIGEFGLGEEAILLGHVLGMKRNLITFDGHTAAELERNYHKAVDDYLEACKSSQIKPEIPFKGSFNIRIGCERHTVLAREATRKNTSINNLIISAIDQIYAM